MRCVVIGGSGHIGSYLIPMLIGRGYEVHNVTRGQAKPYVANSAWKAVTHHAIDRAKEDENQTFGPKIVAMEPDIVIDLICFTRSSAAHLVDVLRGKVQHFLHCGTIWVHGHSSQVPATEDLPRHPFGEYGVNKAETESYLLAEARRGGFPATILHPGHIVGPGWGPLNPAGHFNLNAFSQLASGRPLALPHLGMETLHHVHAMDVATAFIQAIDNWSASVGENFHIVSPAAITLRGYAQAVANWFGHEAQLEFLPWDQFAQTVSPEEAAATQEHIAHSPNASIEKATRLIGYRPRYSSLEAIREAVFSLVADGRISIALPVKSSEGGLL